MVDETAVVFLFFSIMGKKRNIPFDILCSEAIRRHLRRVQVLSKIKNTQRERKKVILHKEGAEWLTREICDYYREKARNISNRSMGDSQFGNLCRELIERCDITETQAINILNGYYVNDYVAYYDRIRDPQGVADDDHGDTKEYLEWLAQKEEKDNNLKDYDLLNED